MSSPLKESICMQARLSKDERFDGQFYTAVLTTGIYCRPICPARAAKEENVRYYQSAIQAEHNGYQPCKRCKPELAPSKLLPSILTQALNILNYNNALNVSELALALNISERQLQRHFLQELGISPNIFINQTRLICARNLLLTTHLSMANVAMVSGYGSIRSFNEHVKKQYTQTPLQLRKTSKRTLSDGIMIQLPYEGDLNWPLMLTFLKNRLIPSIEAVEDSYKRTISMGDCQGWIEISKPETGDFLQLYVLVTDYSYLASIIKKARKLFDLDCHLPTITKHLSSHPIIKNAIAHFPGLRLPGCWDIFEFSIRAILGQQISVKAATTLAGRIVKEYAQPPCAETASILPDDLTLLFPSAESLLNATFADLGITNTRMQTLQRWVKYYLENESQFTDTIDPSIFEQQLCQVKGIGPWTANYLAMRGLGLPDAFPAADLGIIKALSTEEKTITAKEILILAEQWRPWRAYAALYLWQSLSLKH